MRKKIAIALTAGVAAATVGFGAAGTASAAPNAQGACVQAGISTLKTRSSFGLLAAAERLRRLTRRRGGFDRAARGTDLSSIGRQRAADEPPDTLDWCVDLLRSLNTLTS